MDVEVLPLRQELLLILHMYDVHAALLLPQILVRVDALDAIGLHPVRWDVLVVAAAYRATLALADLSEQIKRTLLVKVQTNYAEIFCFHQLPQHRSHHFVGLFDFGHGNIRENRKVYEAYYVNHDRDERNDSFHRE